MSEANHHEGSGGMCATPYAHKCIPDVTGIALSAFAFDLNLIKSICPLTKFIPF